MKKFLYLLALIPSLAFGASDVRTEKQETLFQKGVAYTRRDESSGATVNALATTTTYIKLASVVSTVNGMAAPTASESPKFVLISNMTGGPVIFAHASASATAANRFDLPGAEDLEVGDRSSASFIYDHTAQRWVVAGGGGGGGAADAIDLTYTPSVGADWPDPDPVNGQEALDDLAERVTDNTTDIATKLTTPSGAQNGLVIEQSGGSPAWKSQAPRKNWLVNESFEYATATSGWTTSAATFAADTGTKVYGAQSMKMTFTSGAGSISQSVTPPVDYQGKSIQHTAWVKTTDPGIDVCSLRGGSVFECKRAPADGLWHEVGFTYNDPGTGTRGISIARTTGGASDTWIDGVYVGPYEPNVPAVINVGRTWVGQIKISGCSGAFSTLSTSYGDLSTPSGCTYTVHPESNSITAPSSQRPGLTINSDGGMYLFEAIGYAGQAANTNESAFFRFYDGSTFANEENVFSSASYAFGNTVSGSFELQSGSHQIRIGGKVSASPANASIYATSSGGYTLTINVYRILKDTKLAGAIITDEPWYYISSKMTTRVTSTPDAEGEYRSFQKASSAFTGSDAAPATAPSSADGFKMTPIPYGGAGSSGEQRYEFFAGKGLTLVPEFYSSTGRTGPIDATFREYGGATLTSGVGWSYDPVTGVVSIDSIQQSTSTTTRYFGWTIPTAGGAYSQQASGYFDFKVFNNPLAAGMKSATDYEMWSQGNGHGSPAAYVRRLDNLLEKRGDATTCSDSATNGFTCTINKDGIYSIQYSDLKATVQPYIAITKQGASGATSLYSLSDTKDILGVNEAFTSGPGQVTYTGPLSKGDVVKPHVAVTSFDDNSMYTRWVISKVPSPFEVAGAMGGDDEYEEYLRMTTACTSAGACAVAEKSSGVVSVTQNGTGIYDVVFASTAFNGKTPTCVGGAKGLVASIGAVMSNESSTGVTVSLKTVAGANGNDAFNLVCTAKK